MAWHLVALNVLIHTAVGGSLFLLAAALVVRWCRQPVRRLRLIELALGGALLLPLVSQLPGLPRWSAGLLPLEPAPGTSAVPPGQNPTADSPERLPSLDASLVLAATEPAVSPERAEPAIGSG